MLFMSCEEKNLEVLPLQSESGFFNAVIEIPAGTNKKYEYHPESLTFEIDQRNGTDRVINYLPYFANYGYIPSTVSDVSKGGDGAPLDVFVISESLPQGTLIPIIPLAAVQLTDDNEEDYKIISVPADEELNLLKVKNFSELKARHPSVILIIETWLSNYDSDPVEIKGWLDEKQAEKYILDNKKN